MATSQGGNSRGSAVDGQGTGRAEAENIFDGSVRWVTECEFWSALET